MKELSLFGLVKEIFISLPIQTKMLFGVMILLRMIIGIFGAKIKGAFGEFIVKKKLTRLNKYKYMTLNDVLIKSTDGTTQIDHIVVSIYGIFVIETKHYKGWIHGNEYQPQWTQSIYKKKIKIPNPVRQNYGHVMNLKALLEDYPEIPIHSIVVFTGGGTLKNVNTKTDVIYVRDLVNLIDGYSVQQVLDTRDMEDIIRIITSENILDFKSKRKHIKDIRENLEGKKKRTLEKQMIQESGIKVENQINEVKEIKEVREIKAEKEVEEIKDFKEQKSHKCGFCGKDLVLRKGKHGEFYGCSGFPGCRFTRGVG